MKKLNKEHLKRKEEALDNARAALEESAAKLNAAIEAHNELPDGVE